MLLTGAGITASAQNEVNNWFIQPQVGATYTVGDAGFGKLVSPAGQISAGKYFSEAVGARLAISGWRGNGVGSNGFYYGAATIDGLFNMSTLFAGSNPERFFKRRLSQVSVTTRLSVRTTEEASWAVSVCRERSV